MTGEEIWELAAESKGEFELLCRNLFDMRYVCEIHERREKRAPDRDRGGGWPGETTFSGAVSRCAPCEVILSVFLAPQLTMLACLTDPSPIEAVKAKSQIR